MIIIKFHCNINSVNVEYDFTFQSHLELKKSATMTIQILPLTMFSTLYIYIHTIVVHKIDILCNINTIFLETSIPLTK
jgi:hypothetical protein